MKRTMFAVLAMAIMLMVSGSIFPAQAQESVSCHQCEPSLTYQFRHMGTTHLTADVLYLGCRPEMEFWEIHATWKPAAGRQRAGLYVTKSILKSINPVEAIQVKNQITTTVRANLKDPKGRPVLFFWPAELRTSDGVSID